MNEIVWEISPPVSNDRLNTLFAAAWEDHKATDFQQMLRHSLLYVCAYDHDHLIGFVNVAWDGGVHAFLLDTTVHPRFQRQGIGTTLVQTAVEAVRKHGIEWLHVDFEPHLRSFYERCGFRSTDAGLINVRSSAI
ncbi:MAG: GNAT family N-acetyltransferase [Chloroflexi bacterium]|nr:GNAT family N-acetyltransferase [Chloroflexota bacterium]